MSSRALRKLQGDKELEIPNDEDCDDLNVVAVKSTKKKKGVANPFDLLNEESEHSNEDSEEGEGKELSSKNLPMQNEVEGKQNDTKMKQLPRKKKKKRKKKGKEDCQDGKPGKDEENIDGVIREVNKLLGTKEQHTLAGPVITNGESTSITLDTRALLGVEHRNLNAENEMKRRFGSHIVRAESRQRKSHRTVYHRSSWMVCPKQTWPKMGKTGISMKLLETKNGYNYFAFEHSLSYQSIQFQFLDAVESLNPNNISAILNTHPYHVDSLLQLSEICKMGEDYQMAAELIERALYCFECSFHTLFSLTQGRSRLDYRRSENRSFFIALFRQLVFVGQKGCYRTALEFCKLLLSLDPDDDPLCVLLMIDFYALRTEQFGFLIRLFEEWESHKNLSQLPNFAFSTALAYFYTEKQHGVTRKADEMLQKALIQFPAVLSPLMDKCSVVLDSSLVNHSFFSPTSGNSEPIALKQLESLYIGRCFHEWKDPEVIDWLVLNAKQVIERVETKDPLIAECEHRRKVRYRGTPRNVYRHIVMSDIKDATASLPMDLANVPLLSYDPLPPQDSTAGYTRPERSTAPEEEHSALSMFFRSLLPSFDAQNPNVHAQEVEIRLNQPVEGAEGGAARPLRDTELARGVENLMVAMRELLNTLSFRGHPEEAGDGRQNDYGGNHVEEEEWED